jgi:hypothetical protein
MILHMKANILLLFECCSFGILSKNFEDKIFIRRGECSDPNNLLSLGSLVRRLIWALGH